MDDENIEFSSLPHLDSNGTSTTTNSANDDDSENGRPCLMEINETNSESSCSSFAEEGLDMAANFCNALEFTRPESSGDAELHDAKEGHDQGKNSDQDVDTDEGDDNGERTWSYIPVEPWVHNAEPTARVFGDTLYIYTSWDHEKQYSIPYAMPSKKTKKKKKKNLSEKFSMPGYRVYSCDKSALYRPEGWTAHGSIMMQESIPWVYKGKDKGFSRTAKMWAPDCVRGDDGLYYLFFPAPQRTYISQISKVTNRIGVATSAHPTGPFIPREVPIKGSIGNDPSVLRLKDGRWAMFTSGGGEIWMQYIDCEFKRAISKRIMVAGLENGHKKGPFAMLHEETDSVMLYYSLSSKGKYSILQGKAYDCKNPVAYEKNSTVIHSFDGRTNHASIVPDYKGKTWAFFHKHTEAQDEEWSARRVVFMKASISNEGKMQPIVPRFY